MNDIKSPTLKEKAYAAIKTAIYQNDLPQGTPLVEKNLSDWLEISRTPIRAALMQLVFEKYAVVDRTGHIHVSTITPKNVSDVMVLRNQLEPLALTLADWDNCASQIKALENTHQEMAALVESQPQNNIAYALLDARFHLLLSSMNSNELLQDTIEKLHLTMTRVSLMSGTISPNKVQAIEEHRFILDFVKAHQAQMAIAALQDHLTKVEARILNYI